MGNCRYSVYSHDGESISLIDSYDIWADVVLNIAGLNLHSVKDDIYIVDHYALEGDDDVFVAKPSQGIKSTGHRRQCYLDDLYLTPINLLKIGELAEVLPIPESNLVLASLGDAKPVLDELLHQGEDKQLNAQLCDMAAMRYSPITRFLDPNNDVCLQLYLKGHVVAIASFSRYVEDHRFPFSKHEISYELALHTVFVKPEYRNIGLATSLSKAIIAIAKHDMKRIQKVLSVGNLRLSPWFSAIALSAGGEAICDQISEAFVEANEDVFDELEEKGLKVTYQEPIICVESLA